MISNHLVGIFLLTKKKNAEKEKIREEAKIFRANQFKVLRQVPARLTFKYGFDH